MWSSLLPHLPAPGCHSQPCPSAALPQEGCKLLFRCSAQGENQENFQGESRVKSCPSVQRFCLITDINQGAVGFAGTAPLPWWWQPSPPWSAKSWHTPRQNTQFWFVNNLTVLKIWGTMLINICMSSAPHEKSTCSRGKTSIRRKMFPVSDCLCRKYLVTAKSAGNCKKCWNERLLVTVQVTHWCFLAVSEIL